MLTSWELCVEDVGVVIAEALSCGRGHYASTVRDMPLCRNSDVVDAKQAGFGMWQVFGWNLQLQIETELLNLAPAVISTGDFARM